jgi:hypothetical protein
MFIKFQMGLLIRLKRIQPTNSFESHDLDRSISPNLTHCKLGIRYQMIEDSSISQSHKLSIQKPSQHERRLLIRLKMMQPTNNFEFHDLDRSISPNLTHNKLGIRYPTIGVSCIS